MALEASMHTIALSLAAVLTAGATAILLVKYSRYASMVDGACRSGNAVALLVALTQVVGMRHVMLLSFTVATSFTIATLVATVGANGVLPLLANIMAVASFLVATYSIIRMEELFNYTMERVQKCKPGEGEEVDEVDGG